MFCLTGVNAQSQKRYPFRTAIDMGREQTINKGAKTTGGMNHFASSASSVQKWALTRSDVADSQKALREMTGSSGINSQYKSLHPGQIISSETKVSKVTEIIENQFSNLFGLDIDVNSLVNISSGTSLPQHLTNAILNHMNVGSKLADKFFANRLTSSNEKFHDAIKTNDTKSFRDTKKSCKP